MAKKNKPHPKVDEAINKSTEKMAEKMKADEKFKKSTSGIVKHRKKNS